MNQSFTRFVLELSNQEYNGDLGLVIFECGL